MLKMNKHIQEMKTVSYSNLNVYRHDMDILDCSMGTSPYENAFSSLEALAEVLGRLTMSDFLEYPHGSPLVTKKLLAFWNLTPTDPVKVFLGGGSMELLSMASRLFLGQGKTALGYAPQFSEFENEVKRIGGRFESVSMLREKDFVFDVSLIISKIRKEHHLIYIDNPNNPTGKIIRLADIEALVDKAKSLGICCIIDEAYGDFMEKENSAIQLLKKYDNLVVLRSFSKGLGLAGLRAGYLMTSSAIALQLDKLSNPFSFNVVANQLCIYTLENMAFLQRNKRIIKAMNKALLSNNLSFRILQTTMTTPIVCLYHDDPKVNFAQVLYRKGIKVVPGDAFNGLGQNYVRMRLPRTFSELGRIIELLKAL